MLLDHVAGRQQPPQEEGVRVAGLLDLVALAKLVGYSVDGSKVRAMRDMAMYDPGEAFIKDRSFIDPIGRLMVDTGPTYEGKRLREYQSVDTLLSRGQKLADYLKGTEMGHALGPHMQDIKVGVTEFPGVEAGFVPPKAGRSGALLISKDADPARVPGYFEHEMQHAYQHMLGMPRGTNPDEMSQPMIDYLTGIGVVRPAQMRRIDNSATAQRIDKGTARYLSTIGEAEARAAQLRQDYVTGGTNYSQLGAPDTEQYRYNPWGYDMGMDFWSLPQGATDGFPDWWQRRNGRP